MKRPASLLMACAVLLSACAARTAPDGRQEMQFHPRYLAKTEIDRVIDTTRVEIFSSLRRIADKLYRRNPREWGKSAQTDREAALARLFSGRVDFPELFGKREGAAALYAFSPDYAGDRVLALMAGLIGMVDAAFEHTQDFYVFDDLHEQKLYNCARNIEIAVWKITSSRNAHGEPLLLANALTHETANLSFEREFGRIIGLLEMLAQVMADKHGRSVTRLTQTVATSLFLPISALGM